MLTDRGANVMIVTAWKTGAPDIRTGVGFGIKLNPQERDRYFKRDWQSIRIKLERRGVIEVNLSKSFWTNCCELRSKLLGKWMIEFNIAPWANREPPKLRLELSGDRLFKLNIL